MADGAAEAASLRAQAATLGVDLTPRQAESLLAFGDLLRRWNRAFNLISRRDIERLVPRHLLDSLSVSPWLRGRSVLDLGTGAGLPGVPLAIAREDVHFTLIDTSERRIRFVRRALRALALENAEARCSDVRALPQGCRFDTVVCRAVADAGTAWNIAAPRLMPAGRLVLMSRTRGRSPDSAGSPTASAGEAAHDATPDVAVDAEAAGIAVPRHARLAGRHLVRINGLERPHEVLVLEPAREGSGP